MAPSPKFGPKKISSQATGSVRKSYAPSSSQPILNISERVELSKLAAILPSVSSESDPTDVVLQAASYIDRLVATVQARVKNGTLPAEALNSLPPLYNTKKPTRRPATSSKSKRSVEKKR